MIKSKCSSLPSTGPSLRWWRGFRNRHGHEITLRRSEVIERGRYSNATEDIIGDYFDVLKKIIDDNNLKDRPQLIFNCDESAVQLNRAAKKVIIPRKSKHAHSMLNGSTQHITVHCCVSAAGCALPPMIVFAKGMPTSRQCYRNGPINAAYASTDSGFMNRHIYLQWFEKVLLKYAPAERPLLLLQDGASAHLGPELIDSAIQNNVILVCFPPKLTHLLQPCDVSLYKAMKSNTASCMQKVKLIRGELWVGKHNFPGIFNEIFLKTFCPGPIIDAFRTCGIYPWDKSVVMKKDVVQKQTKSRETSESQNGENDVSTHIVATANPAHGEASADKSLNNSRDEELAIIEVETVTPSTIPAEAEVIFEASCAEPQPCPPELALKAIEETLTPKKYARYVQMQSAGQNKDNDPVYSTWAYLRAQVKGAASPPLMGDHPLVKAGVIPRRLVDVFHVPPEKEPALRR